MLGLIVAMDPHQGIGKGDFLPWHIKEDLQLFKRTTEHKTIIMGERTFNGLPKPLANRKTIVVTMRKDALSDHPDVSYCTDLIGLLRWAKQSEEEVYVCGGASIYQQSLPYVDRLCISYVKQCYEVDTYFPPLDLTPFEQVKEEAYDAFVYREYIRKGAKL